MPEPRGMPFSRRSSNPCDSCSVSRRARRARPAVLRSGSSGRSRTRPSMAVIRTAGASMRRTLATSAGPSSAWPRMSKPTATFPTEAGERAVASRGGLGLALGGGCDMGVDHLSGRASASLGRPMHAEQSLRDQVALATGRPQDGAPIVQLKGDASNRSYLRVGAWPHSHVVMVMPREATRSEEATQGEVPHELPFVNVHRYLETLGVRVPHILRYDPSAAVMVLEDLGDVTFERALQDSSAEELYSRAVELLARMRAAAEATPDPSCLD